MQTRASSAKRRRPAVAEAEVERRAEDEHEVGVAERSLRACANAAGDRRQGAASHAVHEHGEPGALGEAPPATSRRRPSTRRCRRTAPAARRRASRRAAARRSADRPAPACGARSRVGTARAGPRTGHQHVEGELDEHRARAPGERGADGRGQHLGDLPRLRAPTTTPLVIGRRSATCSISCSAPSPRRPSGAAPPIRSSGLRAAYALATPVTASVTPGPAVTTRRRSCASGAHSRRRRARPPARGGCR